MGERDKGKTREKEEREGGQKKSAFYLEYDVTTPRWSYELSQKVYWECMAVARDLEVKAIPDTNSCSLHRFVAISCVRTTPQPSRPPH